MKDDHAIAPDVPLFGLEEVHGMQIKLLQHIERLLGPRYHAYSIAPAQFSLDGVSCAVRADNDISIWLDINAARDWPTCVAILGHELVYAHDGLTGRPSWLEEGIGCLFGLGQCAAVFGDAPTHMCAGSYREAMTRVAQLPSPFEVVKRLRAQGLGMCSVTPEHLMAAVPALDSFSAHALCATFEPLEVAGKAVQH